ncbi:MAG: NYN domain-containing protein [Tepidiformaceae bacterium]
MALNIFPRRKEPEAASAPEPETTLPEPSPEALDEPRKRTRRGSRGGRGRKRPEGIGPEEGMEGSEPGEPEAAPVDAPAPRARRTRATKPTIDADSPGEQEEAAEAAPPPARRGRRTAAAAAEPGPEPGPQPVTSRRGSRAPADPGVDGVARALAEQSKQIEYLVRLTEDNAHRGGAVSGPTAARARVGVFVDAANVELAIERLRVRIDWAKVLTMLTKDRVLVRALAYSPVHDDPGVSIETQRFAEPFFGKGYKVVTKPLKRFSDGTIKANLDIELALDIITMLDRLDVVCLVSGDGDFQHLVEVVQSRGVRVEVVSVPASTAINLRNAADQFIDLTARVRELRL